MKNALPFEFGVLLRQFRLAAGLSQEALAERAGLSTRAIGALESGDRRAPYPHTMAQLAQALDLSPIDRAQLVSAAARRPSMAAPAPAAAQTSSLPLALTSFIGRERDVEEIGRLLRTTRLLTLTGAGGSGKTRLALEVARKHESVDGDDVWLVELAGLADPLLVPAALVRCLGIQEQTGQQLTATVVRWLAPRHGLLVLDNCEHLIDAVTDLVASILRGCPHTYIMATSRERLRVSGETTWRVPSLSTIEPATHDLTLLADQSDAIRLFYERAAAVRPGFGVTPENIPHVAEICWRLDGLPLAIELAAARVGVLTVSEIALHLHDRFRLLVDGDRMALPRQQTLQATLDWSYTLLTDGERMVFRRLAVFAGGWRMDAAVAVCQDEVLGPDEVLQAAFALVEKSLVTVQDANGESRYRLLETIRQYAWERLNAQGEESSTQRRHVDWCLALVEHIDPTSAGPRLGPWLNQLSIEHDNMRAALDWCHQNEPEIGLRLAAGIWQYWWVRSSYSEARHWLSRLLRRTSQPNLYRGQVLLAAGLLTYEQGDLVDAKGLLEECLATARASGDVVLEANANCGLGYVSLWAGEYDGVEVLLDVSLGVIRQMNDPRGLAMALWLRGCLYFEQGHLSQAEAHLSEGVRVTRASGDIWMLCRLVWQLALVVLDRGDDTLAEGHFQEGLAIAEALGARRQTAVLHYEIANVALWRGNIAAATASHERSLAIARAADDTLRVAWALSGLGTVLALHGDPFQADEPLAESLALFEAVHRRACVAIVLRAQGVAAWHQGNASRAIDRLRQSTALKHDIGKPLPVAECLRDMAIIACGTGQPMRAARLLGAAEAVRQGIGGILAPSEQARLHATISAGRTLAGTADWDTAWAEGARLTRDEAVAYALVDEPEATDLLPLG